MLIPNLVQCFVVFGIFYVHFKQPVLCAVAFLSLIVYCVLTITLTLWRKKFRRSLNKYDKHAFREKKNVLSPMCYVLLRAATCDVRRGVCYA